MLLMVVFDKTALVKFNFKNIRKGKKTAYRNSQNFCHMFVISKKKTIPWGMDSKIYRNFIAYGFLFFVISISALLPSDQSDSH
jgi:hypothetical protein